MAMASGKAPSWDFFYTMSTTFHLVQTTKLFLFAHDIFLVAAADDFGQLKDSVYRM